MHHPDHWAPIEVLTPDGEKAQISCVDLISGLGLDFDLGCVIKYIWRAGKKKGASRLDDLRKAQDYLAHAIEREEDNVLNDRPKDVANLPKSRCSNPRR